MFCGETIVPERLTGPQLSFNFTIRSSIFGVNLYEYNLASKVESMFEELVAGKGAVRKTLEKYLN